MKAVVDTSALVHLWRDGGRALDVVTHAVVPLATHAELMVGLEAAVDPARERRRLEGTYAALHAEVVAPNQQTAQHWARLRDQLRRKGRKLPHNDLWIAAAAIELGLPLISLDRHHQGLPGMALLP
ncbi:PIN domain-containing protein [Phycisphaera mikurensis]|uniref:Ribonuclease VapC n=1 Tax=Phycisphaera mikurensis (strain NBRC 102666 / KCTC 22515 / FYK2301M01) TaxID=1142394 RepID=I0IJA6_PHYMF|nr:PIN domain-containing protein [Phycisphaera mikurensis]MBB6441856.1 putative nucleic acid-binding protein [Phycisphaera mikurensis]BAM05344.1 hypothetical protein PSMK_31850 [Phycisphaera mikurensis NBRC 102666]